MNQQNQAGRKPAATVMLLIAVATLPLMSLLTGCKDFFKAVNNNGGGTGTSSYLYTTNVGSGGSGGTITEYSLTSGVLAALSGSPISLPATPTSISVAPNNKFLFVGTSLGLFVYTIGTDGSLTEGNNNNVIPIGSTQPQLLAIDSTSSWLIVANKDSPELDALPIDPTTGVPTSSAVTVQLDAASPQQIAISPANNNIFVALGTGGTDGIGFAPKNASPMGTPVQIALHASGGADNSVAFDTTSTYVFIGENNTNVLRQIAISDLGKDIADEPVGKNPSAILASADGNYVYVANKTDGNITGFSLTAASLQLLDASPFATAKSPIALIQDSSKSYIFCAGFGANPNLWEYYFDSTVPGTLDVKNSTSTTSTSPSNSNAIAATH